MKQLLEPSCFFICFWGSELWIFCTMDMYSTSGATYLDESHTKPIRSFAPENTFIPLVCVQCCTDEYTVRKSIVQRFTGSWIEIAPFFFSKLKKKIVVIFCIEIRKLFVIEDWRAKIFHNFSLYSTSNDIRQHFSNPSDRDRRVERKNHQTQWIVVFLSWIDKIEFYFIFININDHFSSFFEYFSKVYFNFLGRGRDKY